MNVKDDDGNLVYANIQTLCLDSSDSLRQLNYSAVDYCSDRLVEKSAKFSLSHQSKSYPQMDDSEERPKKKKQIIADLERRVKRQEGYITMLNWILGVLSVLLTVSTIAVPVYQYVTVTLPSKELIANLETKVNQRIEQAIKDNRQAEIDSLFNYLLNKEQDDIPKKFRAVNFFNTYTASVLSDKQVRQFLAVIDLKDDGHSSLLSSIYELKNSETVIKFSKQQLKDLVQNSYTGAGYLIKYLPYTEQTKNLIQRYIIKTKEQNAKIDCYTTCFHAGLNNYTETGDREWALAFLNSKTMIDNIQLGTALNYKANYKVTMDNWVEENGEDFIKDTYCYKVVSH